jgi:hypothetical protein
MGKLWRKQIELSPDRIWRTWILEILPQTLADDGVGGEEKERPDLMADAKVSHERPDYGRLATASHDIEQNVLPTGILRLENLIRIDGPKDGFFLMRPKRFILPGRGFNGEMPHKIDNRIWDSRGTKPG